MRNRILRSIIFALPVVIVTTAFAQNDLLNVLRVRVENEPRIKPGAMIQASVVDDFYVNDELIVPKGSLLIGKIDRTVPVSRHARLDAISHGDFTPLCTPEIIFSDLRLSDGRDVKISAETANAGSETVHFYARGSRQPSWVKQWWTSLVGRTDSAVKAVTAPGKKDRIEEYLYSQLPYHPQEIEQGTVYDLHLRKPIALAPSTRRQVSPEHGVEQNAQIKARLVTPLNSSKVKNGDAVVAVITAPEFDGEHRVQVPEGALLYGRVVHVRAARTFGRNGALRFSFEKLQLPEGFEQQVSGAAKAIDSAHDRELAIDTEGGVQPPSNKGVLAPLTLAMLSASAITEDEAPGLHAGLATNGFGLITRVLALTTKSNVVGGVLGGITGARMVYSRFLAHGKDVVFDRGTGIEVDMGTAHKPMPRSETDSR